MGYVQTISEDSGWILVALSNFLTRFHISIAFGLSTEFSDFKFGQ